MDAAVAANPQPAQTLQVRLQALAEQLDASSISLALARRRDALMALEAEQRSSASWDAVSALQLAHLWLVAGVPGRGDDLVLEADQLAPHGGLIPDWWGLWPQQAAGDPAASSGPSAAAVELASLYVELRHLPALQAWQAWLQQVQHDWRSIDLPEQRLLLGLVMHGRKQLPGALEPALEQLVGEEVIGLDPALAWRFFEPLCERLPQWGYGRLKATDLCLQRGELERCRQLLEGASEAQWQLAWLHDIKARLRLAEGDVAAALAAWQQAIERCEQAEVVEIFRQRAREARRGPGVLQARSLLNRGEQAAAVALLELLLQQDPQWQPLRSLLEQARPVAAGSNASGSSASGASTAAAAAGSSLARLEARLQLLAQRAGLELPPAASPESGDAAGFERFLQQAMGRLALLG